jgi:hypothetical protein
MRFVGVAGVVLLAFGLIPFALSGIFDLWTAVHVTGGGVLLASAVVLNFARVRSAVVARRTRQRVQAVIGSVLFAGLLVAANVVSARHPWTWDTTAERIFTLSPAGRSAAVSLGQEVELIAFLGTGDPNRDKLRALLERFSQAGPRLTWRMVDPVRDPQLAAKLGVESQGVVVAATASGSARQGPDPTLGWTENGITRLLVRVTRSGPRVLYAVVGHGEAAPDDLETPGGMGALARALEDGGFEVRPVVLSSVPAVPDDAAALIVAGPRDALPQDEVERIRAYAATGGAVLVLVDAGVEPGPLGALLSQNGIVLGMDVVVDPERVAFLGPRAGFAPIVGDFPEHGATRGFSGRLGLDNARSVSVMPMPADSPIEAAVVARTSESSWAEANPELAAPGAQIRRDAGDLPGPVPVAVASRARLADGRGVARWFVIGDSSVVRNAGLGVFQNRSFVLRAIDWVVGDARLVSDTPRALRASRLDLTEADHRNLFRLTVLLLPEAIVIVGLGVWWRRRSL